MVFAKHFVLLLKHCRFAVYKSKLQVTLILLNITSKNTLMYHVQDEYLLLFFLQENVGDAELKQQKSETESSEEQENTDDTVKESSCHLLEEAELRDALKHIMRQGSLLSTTDIRKRCHCAGKMSYILNSVHALV